jgi:hypothetical protein
MPDMPPLGQPNTGQPPVDISWPPGKTIGFRRLVLAK